LLDQLDGLHQKTPESRLLNLAGLGAMGDLVLVPWETWSWCYGRSDLDAMGEDEQHLEVPTKELRGDPANRDMILHQEGVSSQGKTVTSALQELSGLNTYQC